MLTLTSLVRDQMVAHAIECVPHEACGLFATAPGELTVQRFYPMTNAAESAEIYQLDAAEMMQVEGAADATGLQVAGVMHSHTHTAAYPSPTDVRDAATFDPFGAWHYIIVSLEDAEPVLRSYRLENGTISEEQLVVEPPA